VQRILPSAREGAVDGTSFLEHIRDLTSVGNVGTQSDRSTAETGDLVGYGARLVFTDHLVDSHRRVGFSHGNSDRPADPRSGSALAAL